MRASMDGLENDGMANVARMVSSSQFDLCDGGSEVWSVYEYRCYCRGSYIYGFRSCNMALSVQLHQAITRQMWLVYYLCGSW